jgi:uncharacterized protein (TIGR02421 family)
MNSTNPSHKGPARPLSRAFIRQVSDRLATGRRVRRNLPGWGRIAVDRQLPFLVVYRRPPSRSDAGTDLLVTSEASYLTFPATRSMLPGVQDLIRSVAAAMVREFGAFLVLEVWSSAAAPSDESWMNGTPRPRFELVAPRRHANARMTEHLVQAFGDLKLGGVRSDVSVACNRRRGPRKMPPLLSAEDEAALSCHLYGLEVAPVYRDPATGETYPLVLRDLRRGLTLALRRMVFEFARRHTTQHPPHFHAMGRRAMVRAVWDSDRQLVETSERFDLLLAITPMNGEAAWHEFKRSGFQRRPGFHYRPLPADPVVLKRALYRAPVERIEDPALARVFREKQAELDNQITLLQDRNTSRFLHAGIRLFGGVGDTLFDQARAILESIQPRSREVERGRLSAQEFADRAREEIRSLQEQLPDIAATVEIRDDIAGLMVSRGNLLVSRRTAIPRGRVEALLQHEVGTHVLTYHNGKTQRLQLLAAGLAGYDELQEGLAVLAEYLVGGLSRPRMRLLAGRVVAARYLLDGATFVDTYRALHHENGFARETSFSIAMRTHRGGGITKDAIYLRGLRQILRYLQKGGELQPLWVGKIAAQHVPIIRELQWRGVVQPAPLVPRYLDLPGPRARLEGLRRGMSILDLCKRS